MREPWIVFAELYFEALRSGKSHDIAVISPFSALLFDFQNRRESPPTDGLAKMKIAADNWHVNGGHDRDALRQALRHAWTDWVLERGRR